MSGVIEIASQDAEALVLGRMINSSSDRKLCYQGLSDYHFFFSEHITLFKALCRLESEQKSNEIHEC